MLRAIPGAMSGEAARDALALCATMRTPNDHRSPITLVALAVLAACSPRQDLDAIAARFPAGSPRGVVEALASIDPPRNADHPESLERTARFIARRMTSAGLTAALQPFTVGSKQYYNVSAVVGSGARKRIVVGAHYDVYGETPGADDNASGVAALLQVASKLAGQPLAVDVELVAYALEEPPHFGTEDMGSARHARALARAGFEVVVMISLEMLGYYSDEPDSQKFPQPGLERYFPTVGNYVAVLGLSDDAAILERIRTAMSGASDLKAFALSGPPQFPGISQSDHSSYWRQGFPAVLVTDTAYFRNPHYHQLSDKPETLDYHRLEKAADAVHAAVVELAR